MVFASTSVHMVEGAPKISCCQCLCPQHELQFSRSRLAGGADPGSFPITAFALGSGSREILCVPFKSETSISHSLLGLRKVGPTGLQNQMFWGLSSHFRTPGLRTTMWGLDPLLLEGNLCNYHNYCNFFLFVDHPPRGVGLDYTTSLPLLPSHCGSFFISLDVDFFFC